MLLSSVFISVAVRQCRKLRFKIPVFDIGKAVVICSLHITVHCLGVAYHALSVEQGNIGHFIGKGKQKRAKLSLAVYIAFILIG